MFTLGYLTFTTTNILVKIDDTHKSVSFNVVLNSPGLIDWGDGITEEISESGKIIHTYENNNEFEIKFPETTQEIEIDENVQVTNILQLGSNLKYLNGYTYEPFSQDLTFTQINGWIYEPTTYDLTTI